MAADIIDHVVRVCLYVVWCVYLRGGGRGHGRDEQGIVQAVAGDPGPQPRPVPALRRRDPPQVRLQQALAGRRPGVRRVRGADAFGEFARGLEGGEVDGFEDVAVQAPGFVRVEGQTHQLERVREA